MRSATSPSSNRSSRRTRKSTRHPLRRNFFRPRVEMLESRRMLSTIQLTMRGFDDVFGTTPFLDIDNDGIPETRSAVAQNVVRAAAGQWEAMIKNFNYTEGSFWLIVSATGASRRFSHVQSRFLREIAF